MVVREDKEQWGFTLSARRASPSEVRSNRETYDSPLTLVAPGRRVSATLGFV